MFIFLLKLQAKQQQVAQREKPGQNNGVNQRSVPQIPPAQSDVTLKP